MARRSPQAPQTNLAEYTVSELAFALRKTVEDAYGHVRLRGEVSGYRGPHASGHCYFRLKDESAAIEAVVWRGTFGRLKFKPEEGLEIVAKGKESTRVVLKLHPRLAPIKVAVFPLVKKDGMPEVAQEIYGQLKPNFSTFYDAKGAVGRRYRRQDEIGTPWCVTVDVDSLEDGAVTVRDRDTMAQERIAIAELLPMLHERSG